MRQPNRTAVPEGFTLRALGGRWFELSHDECVNACQFVNATTGRVAFYANAHRCGEPGSYWHIGYASYAEAAR